MARPLGVALALLVVLLTASCCAGRDFYVGGRDGWTVNPAEPFNHWAERNRFQVNDTLVFRYNKDADAVLLVSQSHYDTCNTTQPFLRFDGGDSRFGLTNSGPYFFISADAGRCQNGELVVVVLAVRPPPQLTSPPPVATPTPRALPPSPAPACAGNSSAPSPATVPTPAPVTNRTSEPPSPSSASAKRGDGLAAFLIIGGEAILI